MLNHMDYFNDVFTTFLGPENGIAIGCNWRDRKFSNFMKKIFICVPKMNECLMGLK